jgi:hypothetical protein
VRSVLQAVATKPSAVMEPAAAALVALGRLCPADAAAWISAGLQAIAPFAREEARRRFFEEMGAAHDVRSAKLAVRALFRACKPP